MNCAVKFDQLRQQGSVTTDEALAFFDELEPVDQAFMLGNWCGDGFATGHRMDGLLERYNWYGKRFETTEKVHPLVFKRRNGELVSLNPILFPLPLAGRNRFSTSELAKRIFDLTTYVAKTDTAKARLRMTEYRGKVSATMVYDQIPVNDIFRKIDDNTVLGIMDQKGAKQPYFFVLKRES